MPAGNPIAPRKRASANSLTPDAGPRKRPVAAWPSRPLPLGDGLTVDEPLGHALAALDAQWVILAVPAIAGQEERLRKFASVLRALPAWPAQPSIAGRTIRKTTESPFGHSATRRRPSSRSPTTRLTRSGWLACWMRRPRQVSRISDATSALFPRPPAGGRQLVIDLLPYGVSAIRVGAARAQISDITPYPSDAVLTSMEARVPRAVEPARPAESRLGQRRSASRPTRASSPRPSATGATGSQHAGETRPPVAGSRRQFPAAGSWSGREGLLDRDRRLQSALGSRQPADHRPGRACIRVQRQFVPNSASSVMIQAYFRAEPPATARSGSGSRARSAACLTSAAPS